MELEIPELSDEIWYYIFTFVISSVENVNSAILVCHNWQDLIENAYDNKHRGIYSLEIELDKEDHPADGLRTLKEGMASLGKAINCLGPVLVRDLALFNNMELFRELLDEHSKIGPSKEYLLKNVKSLCETEVEERFVERFIRQAVITEDFGCKWGDEINIQIGLYTIHAGGYPIHSKHSYINRSDEHICDIIYWNKIIDIPNFAEICVEFGCGIISLHFFRSFINELNALRW